MKKLQRKIYNIGIIFIFIFITVIYNIEDKQVSKEYKYVALTYDDGPSIISTKKILNLLEKYDASATFFINGNHANNYKELVKEIYNKGNEIGNHTLDHGWLTKMNEEEVRRQIYGNEALLEFLSGQNTDMLVRPPYGDINQKILKEFDVSFIMWSVDSRDWEVQDVAVIQDNVFENVQDGDIIIMHDGYESTVQATEHILKRLTKEGFKVVSVTELFNLKNREIPIHEKVYHCK